MVVYALMLFMMMAQSATPSSQPTACQQPEFAQFDFWIGEWDVFAPTGNRAGHNSISRTHAGCVIHERWTGAGGMTGSSFNIYTPSTRKWHQLWVDSGGTLLQLEGEFNDGRMRLEGEGLTAKGPMRNRITWTPLPDGTLRQFWEISTDGGKSWQVSFDGTYRKAAK